jgi:hypothetical protein
MDLRVYLSTGPVSLLVTTRTQYDGAVGAELLLATPEDLRRWVSHYRSVADPRAACATATVLTGP